VVAVGDERQAIYGWRGAANDSMARMAKDLRMRSLPLHVSYRCPRAVVAVAQRYVSHIQAHDAAPMGTVIEEAKPVDELDVRSGDMVLCRTTAPVVRTAWALLRAGTPAVVLGRDIGAGIHALVKRLKPKDLADLDVRLSAWLTKETAKADKADDPARKESAEDRAATVRVFAGMVETLEEMRAKIDETFKDAKTDTVVTCCTIHKAKGLEAERVFVLDWHKMPPKWATKDWMLEQETNLMYVAVTRAKAHLQFALSPARDESLKSATPSAAPTQWVLLRGNTFPVKDILRETYGARVSKVGETWQTHVPADRARDAQSLVYEVAGSSARATRRYRRW
jgi:superfamily I DNA/RNA helicase